MSRRRHRRRLRDRGPPRRPGDDARGRRSSRASSSPARRCCASTRFALTANNVTYATLGDVLRYWRFFPAAEEGWGRVPVWGFADVVASRAEGLEAGERVYGYFPMATHLRAHAGAARRRRLRQRRAAPRRAARLLQPLPAHGRRSRLRPAREAEQMLLRPLFATSFLIDDQLADEGYRGAARVVLSSASSKTAYGTAFLLAQRERRRGHRPRRRRATRTSSRGLGSTTASLTYDEVGELRRRRQVAYVDMSGDGAVRAALHRALGDRLVLDLIVGATHREALGRRERPARARRRRSSSRPAAASSARRSGGRASCCARIGRGVGRLPGVRRARRRAGGAAASRARTARDDGAGDLARDRRRRGAPGRPGHIASLLSASGGLHGPSRSHTTRLRDGPRCRTIGGASP